MTQHEPVTAETFPTTHEQAVDLSPFEVARLWGQQPWPPHSSPDWAPEHELRELAAMSALASWVTRWQANSAHQALRGGASLRQVADAIGCTPEQAAETWREWAARQVALHGETDGRVGLDPAERDQVAAVVDDCLTGGSRVAAG